MQMIIMLVPAAVVGVALGYLMASRNMLDDVESLVGAYAAYVLLVTWSGFWAGIPLHEPWTWDWVPFAFLTTPPYAFGFLAGGLYGERVRMRRALEHQPSED